MIVSFLPGRVRLRFAELKTPATADAAKARILQTPGIRAVETNPLTGSILIEYDPAVLPAETLLETGKQELAKLGLRL